MGTASCGKAKDRKMNNLDHVVTDTDRRRLGSLLTTSAGRAWGTLQTVGELETLLEEASSVDSEDAPETLVTMNTTVKLVDLDSGARRTVTLVYPQDVCEVPHAASIVEPLGVALIGCQAGDVVQCPDEPGHNFRIVEIVYQPECAGAHHL